MLGITSIGDGLGLFANWESRIWPALAVTIVFTAVARYIRGVSRSGALAGALVCFLLYACAGPGAIVALLSVFVLAWLTTRFGAQRKQRLKIAEKQDGRSASQVLANLGVAVGCVFLYSLLGKNAIFLLAAAASLSEAAADTVSSEVGQASNEEAYLITNWEKVPAGNDGAVSPQGTLAGMAAATIVSLICVVGGLLPWKWLGISVMAAVLGMIADSYLGASLQRRGMLNNDSVNFLSTLLSAVAAFGIASA
ncbi:MAG TPA: DUF92 domain-containing protein [Terriglobales bacterium]|jgi:uncharacterized protein (TIGR00297 family)|nr:DUF92 domain-containing protein [Terriglobales bacterium]